MRLTYAARFAFQVFEMRPDRKKRRIHEFICITVLSGLIIANCMAVMILKLNALMTAVVKKPAFGKKVRLHGHFRALYALNARRRRNPKGYGYVFSALRAARLNAWALLHLLPMNRN